ncbi:MAG: hypothetical protein AB7T86_14705 [Xanthobacteraceae bacterium]|jgi:hypothetical protein|uniref:hypothetical protein n=1 Tax=Pseudolabrys sp. TaxID=1960880 RepID=UPI003D0C9146
MTMPIDHTRLHRTAKYFMDNGRAGTHEEAMALLRRFGLTVHVGPEIAASVPHQTALLTLVNLARRTLLGGVEIVGLPEDTVCLSPLSKSPRVADAVLELGGALSPAVRPGWPNAVIGTVPLPPRPAWRMTWEGWRGGVVPAHQPDRLNEDAAMALAPVLAAAICAAEAFAFHSGDHLLAGRRGHGLSLWQPGKNWLASDETEPLLAYLPSRLWLIGLGNLGQAFAWLLAALPYTETATAQLVLQDFDRIASSNDSTSLLSFIRDIGRRKGRVVADWLEARGFETFIEERRFGEWTRRSADEPGVALCGVDNALARAALEDAGFDIVIEAGLGAGPEAFLSIAMHTFPGARRAKEMWSRQVGEGSKSFENMPAYQRLKDAGMESCGLTQLASRTVGVPFVGLIAGCLVISELLRRLHGGTALEFATGSVSALQDIETGSAAVAPYAYGHVAIG